MAKVTLSVTKTPPVQFPPGTVAGDWLFTVEAVGSDSVVLEQRMADFPAEGVVIFPDVQPGQYVAGFARLDAAGNLLGDKAFSAAFEITAPQPVMVELAGEVSAVVG